MSELQTAPPASSPTAARATVEDAIRSADAFNAECRYREADEVGRQAMSTWPDNPRLAGHYATLAATRGDWASARERAGVARTRFTNYELAFRTGIRAALECNLIDEATDLQQTAERLFANRAWPLYEGARLAEARDDAAEAERYYIRTCDEHPTEVDWPCEVGRFYMRTDRFEAADQTVGDAMSRFPDSRQLHALYGDVALYFGRFEDADRRWEIGKARFPADFAIAFKYANAPIAPRRSRRFDIAASRFKALCEEFPKSGDAFQGYIALLRRMEQPEAAVRIAGIARDRFQSLKSYVGLGIELARLREERGDRDGALRAIRELVEQSPNAMAAWIEWSAMLCRGKRFDEAERICEQAHAHFQFRVEPIAEMARLADLRGDTRGAFTRWKTAAGLAPRDNVIAAGLHLARLSLAEETNDLIGDLASDPASDARKGSLTELMYQFESLSGSRIGGCEMGSVQRWFRAEPIGLMRWGAIETAQLIQALNDKFKGIGELENTTLGLPYIAQNNLQYFVYDSTYTMEFHTFVDKGTISEEVLLKKSCRQLKYLRAKLIRDLEAGNKIFVYRPNSALNGEDIVALGAAMKTYGDAKLLIIQVADSEHCSGDVGFALPNVIIGYINQLNWSPDGGMRTPSYASWARVFKEARALCALS